VHESLFDVGPELGTAMRGADAEVDRESAVQIEGRDGRIAEVDDEVVGLGQAGAEITDSGGFSDAGLPVSTPRPGSSSRC
jgi:hypothetical protein